MISRHAKAFATMAAAALLLGTAASFAEGPAAGWPWGAAVHGYPVTRELIAKASSEMGTAPRIVVFFRHWPAVGEQGEFPEGSLQAIHEAGALPCITWEPFFIRDGQETMIPHEHLTGGVFDGYITAFAKGCAQWGRPLIIRFAHEMNLSRYHWGTEKERYGPESPAIYRKMFRYVNGIFTSAGASNVLWAFCPNAESVPHIGYDPAAGWNRVSDYYPGDDVVDILGMDGYNWGATQTVAKNGWQSQWRSFRETFAPLYTELRTLSPEKPVVVFETASASAGGDKARWVRAMIETARVWRLSGVVWFQVNKEIDWRLGSGMPHTVALPEPVPTACILQWAEGLIDAKP